MSYDTRAAKMSAHAKRLMAQRERLLGPNNAHFYDDPVHFVRGDGVWLYDHDGRRYLDCYNNVPHVGNCHPRVVEVISRQTGQLVTHSRYLHDTILNYAERLLATFDRSLSTMLYTCTGSEANDVALRMAQQATGNSGLIVTDFTFHGNTALVMELATLLPREDGQRPYLRSIPAPDSYHLERGTKNEAEMAAKVIRHLEAAIQSLKSDGHGVAGILICPIFANEGFPDLPAGFLAQIARKIRKAGGLVIADEVQSGFGRTGVMWGHQYSGFVPDIVTLGKGHQAVLGAIAVPPAIPGAPDRGAAVRSLTAPSPSEALPCALAVLQGVRKIAKAMPEQSTLIATLYLR